MITLSFTEDQAKLIKLAVDQKNALLKQYIGEVSPVLNEVSQMIGKQLGNVKPSVPYRGMSIEQVDNLYWLLYESESKMQSAEERAKWNALLKDLVDANRELKNPITINLKYFAL